MQQQQKRVWSGIVFLMMAVCIAVPAMAQDAETLPNILVIWGDDVGVHNISAI